VALASRTRPRSPLGEGVFDLYDYNELRRRIEPTMFVVHVERPTLVLGGSQSDEVIDTTRLGTTPRRRRRGGGGLVLLQPNDLWVDWWIPSNDVRWSHDVHKSSLMVGEWWRELLHHYVTRDIVVHTGSLEGAIAHRLVCFAGRGPGEVFVDDRKAVGVTQWRVREGIFLSTVVHSHSSAPVLEFLESVPEGLAQSLDHQVLSSLGIDDVDVAVDQLRTLSGPWCLITQHLNH
jgi:lipoate-protein ligase A